MNKLNSLAFYKQYCEKILCFLLESMDASNFEYVDESIFKNFDDLHKLFLSIKNYILYDEAMNLNEDYGFKLIEILKHDCTESDFKKILLKVKKISSISNSLIIKKTHEELNDILDNINDYIINRDANKVSSGIYDLDLFLKGGFSPGEFIVISGRPSCGKTSFAINCVVSALKNFRDKKVLFYSMEMSSLQICERFLSNVLNIESEKLKLMLSENDNNLFLEIKKFKLRIVDRLSNFEEIAKDIKRHNNENKLSIVVIDYLQLLNSSKAALSRCYEIGHITQGLKMLSLKLNIPIIGLSQLSRDHVRRQSAPSLADLRDSGSIEQDADVVIALTKRDGMYDNKSQEIVLHLLKNRNGSTGNIQIIHESSKFKFF